MAYKKYLRGKKKRTTLNFADFVLRYAELTQKKILFKLRRLFEIHRIEIEEKTFDQYEIPENERPLTMVASALQAYRPNGVAVQRITQWCTEQKKEHIQTLNFATFVLCVGLFATPEGTETVDYNVHRSRIFELQKEGKIKKSKKREIDHRSLYSDSESSENERTSVSRTYNERSRDSDSEESKDSDDSSDHEKPVSLHILKHRKIVAKVRGTFRRFCRSRSEAVTSSGKRDVLNASEAIQALTELGITVPRTQLLSYFANRGVKARRICDAFLFLQAFSELSTRPKSRRVVRGKQARTGRMTKPESVADYDRYLRKKVQKEETNICFERKKVYHDRYGNGVVVDVDGDEIQVRFRNESMWIEARDVDMVSDSDDSDAKQ